MKALLDSKVYLKALKKIMPFIDKSSTLPILKNVKLTVKGSVVRIEATNLDSFISIELHSEVIEEGSGLYDYKRLVDLAKSEENDQHELSDKNLAFAVSSSDLEDFPDTPINEEATCLITDQKTFKDVLTATLYACPIRDSRPALIQIYCAYDKGILVCVATDGRKLLEKTIAIGGPCTGKSFFISYEQAKKLIFCLDKLDTRLEIYVPVNKSLFLGNVFIKTSNKNGCKVSIDLKTFKGDYPKYKKVFPKGEHTTFMLNVELVKNAFKTMEPYKENKFYGLNVEFNLKDINITSIYEGAPKKSVPFNSQTSRTTSSNRISFFVNVVYVLDLLKAFDKKQDLELRYYGKEKPIVLLQENVRGLIVPIALSNFDQNETPL